MIRPVVVEMDKACTFPDCNCDSPYRAEGACVKAAQAAERAVPRFCTCDGAGRGPGRSCVVKGGGRLGDAWTCREQWEAGRAAVAALPAAPAEPKPVDMVLHCPKCGMQHIDAADEIDPHSTYEKDAAWWGNPPHRSHLCHGCGHIWRPADVPTNGVAAVKTKGKADSPIAAPAPAAPKVDRCPHGTPLAWPFLCPQCKTAPAARVDAPEAVPWPAVTRYSGGAFLNGVSARVWVQFSDDAEEIEYVPATAPAAAAVPVPQPVMLTERQIVDCAVAAGCVGKVTMTYDSGPYEVTRTSVNLDLLAKAIQRATLAANGITQQPGGER